MMNEDLLNRGLPKWPQMYTTGKRVTEDQAMEIIRRTDAFFVHGSGGNDRKNDERLAKRMRMPHFHGWGYDDKPNDNESWADKWARHDKWRELWGAIDTEYVNNRWISSAYIYGPHGWMHPNGKIGYVDNVGKWPSVEDVLKDWAKIAAEFPYLELAATLMNAEYCEDDPSPVVTILVSQGLATVVSGDCRYHEEHERPFIDRSSEMVGRRMDGMLAAEHYPFSERWLRAWESKALEVDAQMKTWVRMPVDVEHDDGDEDDGWKKELQLQREGL